MHFTALTALGFCTAASAGVARSFPQVHRRQAPSVLDAAITAKGKLYAGTALTLRGDATEESIISTEFNSVTPENAMKWESTQPTQGNFTFDGADAIVDFAAANNDQIRCHTLIWYSQLPTWVSQGGFDNATLIGIMETHINAVMGRYAGQCTYWDVVNEALNEDGTYRENVFLTTIGEAYIPISFRLAAAADPLAKLFYNDYNLEYGADTAKALGAARIVELVQSYGERIDGVGLQGHMTSEATDTQSVPTPAQDVLEGVLNLYTDLGVDVAYTELDVRMTTPATPEKLAVQADAYARLVGSCMNVARCVGFTLWGVSDKYSWIPGVFETEGAALVWDESFAKKPAYQAILDTINAAPGTNGTVTPPDSCKRAVRH